MTTNCDPADEKAVAECPFCGGDVASEPDAYYTTSEGREMRYYGSCFSCPALGPSAPESEAIAAFTNPKHFAARIRAEASGESIAEINKLRGLLSSAELLLRRTLSEHTFNRLEAMEFVGLIDAALKGDA